MIGAITGFEPVGAYTESLYGAVPRTVTASLLAVMLSSDATVLQGRSIGAETFTVDFVGDATVLQGRSITTETFTANFVVGGVTVSQPRIVEASQISVTGAWSVSVSKGRGVVLNPFGSTVTFTNPTVGTGDISIIDGPITVGLVEDRYAVSYAAVDRYGVAYTATDKYSIGFATEDKYILGVNDV